MKIILYPSDIVRRCLWTQFSYYVAGSEKEAEKILNENIEFELSERDAIVIGLLKVMETDNLVHRFNDYMVHFLTIKSIKESGDILIRKKGVFLAIDKFLDNFPDYWTPPINYKNALIDLNSYITELKQKIDKVEVLTLEVQNIVQDFYLSNSIKKLLNFNLY